MSAMQTLATILWDGKVMAFKVTVAGKPYGMACELGEEPTPAAIDRGLAQTAENMHRTIEAVLAGEAVRQEADIAETPDDVFARKLMGLASLTKAKDE